MKPNLTNLKTQLNKFETQQNPTKRWNWIKQWNQEWEWNFV